MGILGEDPLQRLKNLLILLSEKFLISYQIFIIILTVGFLIVIAFLMAAFAGV